MFSWAEVDGAVSGRGVFPLLLLFALDGAHHEIAHETRDNHMHFRTQPN